ncbi:MATE family efflux transporter [Kiloniella majae]|uniref:MATE family efflux transporter n=1 Tax=Kiloniella majae TaxID=1938558 RepID=UPI000A27730E|nr:MATE family efflux transporter [Kiloniella majae]
MPQNDKTRKPKAAKVRERDLVRGSIPEHFKALAIPAGIGMLFNTLYNVVDTFFAGMISTDAQAGLSVSFTVFFILIAFGIGLGQGISALVGSAIGAGNQKGNQPKDQNESQPENSKNPDHSFLPKDISAQGLSFATLFSGILCVAGYYAIPHLLDLLGVYNGYRTLAHNYLMLILFAAPAFMIAFAANGILSAQGDTVTNRNALIGGFVANCLLNPLFIFGAFGIPGLGFDGLAISTVIIEWFVALYLLSHALKSRAMAQTKLSCFTPHLKIIKDIVAQGAPASLNFLTITVGVFMIQYFLQPFGATAVAAYGIALRIEQLILLPGLGLTIVLLPIIAQNHGAKELDRVRYAFWWCVLTGIGMMLIGALLLLLGGKFLLGLFTQDPDVISTGFDYLLLAAPMLPAYLTLFAMMSFFQGIKRPIWTVWIGIYRQIFASAGFAALFIYVLNWGAWGVWTAVFTAVWSGLLLSTITLIIVARKNIQGLGGPRILKTCKT